MYGLEHSGIGRYIINLVSGLAKQDSGNNYVLLLKKKYFNELNLPQNWKSDRQERLIIKFKAKFMKGGL